MSNYSVEDIVQLAKAKDIVSNFYPVVVGFAWNETGPKKSNLIAGLYPNPVKSYTNLVLKNDEPYDLEVYSMDGKLMEKVNLKSQKYQLNVENFPSGVYLIRVARTDGSESDIIRFVKD